MSVWDLLRDVLVDLNQHLLHPHVRKEAAAQQRRKRVELGALDVDLEDGDLAPPV